MSGYTQEQLGAAMRDLAEFGIVYVQDRDLAGTLLQSAVQAGYPARVRESGPGWWVVEIMDMRPRAGRKEEP